MRITLSIDDDVFAAAKELATMRGKSVSEVISSLVKDALRPKRSSKRMRNLVLLLPMSPRLKRVTPNCVNRLRDDLITYLPKASCVVRCSRRGHVLPVIGWGDLTGWLNTMK